MWHSIVNKPTKEGIYVVAQFNDKGKLIEYSTDYVLIEGYFGPNNIGNPYATVKVTHWMTYKEYRSLLENTKRQ